MIQLITTDLPGLLTKFLLNWLPRCDPVPESPDALDAHHKSSWAGLQWNVPEVNDNLQGGCQSFTANPEDVLLSVCQDRSLFKLSFFT